MFEFLILILAVCITYLVTDYRRHLQIQNIHTSYDVWMDQISDDAFDSGYEMGVACARYEMKFNNNPL